MIFLNFLRDLALATRHLRAKYEGRGFIRGPPGAFCYNNGGKAEHELIFDFQRGNRARRLLEDR